jgi:hypothetical protein
MNKKAQTVLIVIIALIVIAAVLFFVLRQKPSETKLKLKQIIPETSITQGDRYKRPELIVVDNRLFAAFFNMDKNNFQLVELNEDLSPKSQIFDIYDYRDSVDIRLATDGPNLWYAFESVDKDNLNNCDGHFLCIAKYDISGENPNLIESKLDIAKGCPTGSSFYQNPPEDMPKNPEAVDDPTPIFYNGKYVVLTRGWNTSIQHIRTFDQNFNLIEDFTLDLGTATGDRMLTQNALVNIDDKIYLIGGLFNWSPPSISSIYAVPLSSDLRSVSGDIISLVDYPGQSFKKVTAAKYDNGKLYINYAKVVNRQQFQHLGVFDVKNNFASLEQIQFQDKSVNNNHASIEVLGDRVYVIYQEDQKVNYDILMQVFEW